MKSSKIFSFFKILKQRDLRRKLKIYEAFNRAGNAQVANAVYTELKTIVKFPAVNFLRTTIDSESMSEFLAYRLLNQHLSGHFYSSLFKPERYSLPNNLPQNWRLFLNEKYKIRSTPLSEVKWRLFGSTEVIKSLHYAFKVISQIICSKKHDIRAGIYLDGLTINNIPQSSVNDPMTVVDYFLKLRAADQVFANITSVSGNNRESVIFVKSPFDGMPIRQIPEIITFISILTISSVFSIILGRGVLAVASCELLKVKMAQLLDERLICKEYAFYNSWCIYRPAWTYELEKKGALISLYFYSINCLPFCINGKLTDIHYMYTKMSWTNYLAWNSNFADFLLSNSRFNATAEIIEPVAFSDNGAKMPSAKDKIAVFDVTPTRYAAYFRLAPLTNYYSSNVKNSFYTDIADVCNELGLQVVFKRKRRSNSKMPKSYSKLIQSLECLDNIEFIDPDISAHRLIKQCRAVITMPFSSPAHIGQHYKKPSIYYDGTGLITKSEPTALGIALISNKEELKRWLQSIG